MNSDQRQRMLFIIAGLAITILVADSMVFTPLAGFWKTRSDKITELQRSVARGSILMDREDVIRERWQSMQGNSLPSNPSVAESAVFKSFERWSGDSRISLASVTPLWNPVDTNYMTLEYRADALGNIETITRFLYELENDPLAFKVQSLAITAKDTEGRQLSLSLQLSGLVLDPQQP